MSDRLTQCQKLADDFGKNYDRAIKNPRLTPTDKQELNKKRGEFLTATKKLELTTMRQLLSQLQDYTP